MPWLQGGSTYTSSGGHRRTKTATTTIKAVMRANAATDARGTNGEGSGRPLLKQSSICPARRKANPVAVTASAAAVTQAAPKRSAPVTSVTYSSRATVSAAVKAVVSQAVRVLSDQLRGYS